ncbi:hypothetical protein G5I_04077 [Acromyrmex echinatior]|uniref:Uncharacterized protein n=1 Tax=Acromyrmex echinatior TaxID=103372 RepID=F4WEE5_ACREC|nr:hypothetical protein G5I_04077 [Acromyrmex echinatior]
MPACPLTSQPSHHQSPPSHRVYRKPSVRLSRHVTSRHVARRCCALWCCDVHTAHNGATTENNSFRVPSPLPEYRQCPRLPPSEKKRKKKTLLFFRCCPPSPVRHRAPQKTVLNRKKTLSIAPLRDSPLRSPLLLLLLLLLFHQPSPPPPPPPPPPPTTNHQPTNQPGVVIHLLRLFVSALGGRQHTSNQSPKTKFATIEITQSPQKIFDPEPQPRSPLTFGFP